MNLLNTLNWWQWAIMAAIPPAIISLYFLKLKRQPLEVPSTYLWSRTIEDLHVRGMMANHRLARSIGDAGWSKFAKMLEYKGEWYGCQVVKIDRWYPSSKMCSKCGTIVERLPLSIREWKCPECGSIHDRDVNATVNILKQATVGATESHACGQHVRPGTAAAAGQAG